MSRPTSLAIILGAGPNTGTGIARIFSSPSHGNMALALLARNPENLSSVRKTVLESNPDAVIETFPSDTSAGSLAAAFSDIAAHPSFRGLKLRAAVYSVKHASRKDFLAEETSAEFAASVDTYLTGAFAFAQEAVKRFFQDHGEEGLEGGAGKKGTLIFTGTLAALRTTTAKYAAYAAGRAGVRLLAQGLAKDYSEKGIHVVHAIANGRIEDKDGEEQRSGKNMSADAVGKEYWHLCQQEPALWTHELDMRPALEKF